MFRKKDEQMAECAKCGVTFVMQTYNQRFCTGGCRDSYHNDWKAAAIEAFRKQGTTKE